MKVEFAVRMKCNECKEKIVNELSKLNDIKIVDIDVDQQKLLIELNQNSSSVHEIQTTIESKLGLNTVIKGLGESIAAVSELTGILTKISISNQIKVYLNDLMVLLSFRR